MNIEISNKIYKNGNNYYNNWNELFKSVWNNVVLFRLIFKHVRLYEENEIVEFKNLKSLKDYSEKEYIHTLIYNGKEMLSIGDLPLFSDCLNTIIFKQSELSSINGNILPQGIQKIIFSKNCKKNYQTTPLSTLPNSVIQVKNIVINNNTTIYNNISQNSNNLKTISFGEVPINPSKYIPNSITSLKFQYDGQFPLVIGDIPYGILKLSIPRYTFELNVGVIPCSVTELTLSQMDNTILEQSVIPSSCKILSITGYTDGVIITPQSIPSSVIELTIRMNDTEIQDNSIPTSVTDLTLLDLDFKITSNFFNQNNNLKSLLIDCTELNQTPISSDGVLPLSIKNLKFYGCFNQELTVGLIPCNVTSLSFSKDCRFNKVINQIGLLPSSLTSLELNDCYPFQNLLEMLSIIPETLHTIILPKDWKKQVSKIPFPSLIKNKYFRDE